MEFGEWQPVDSPVLQAEIKHQQDSRGIVQRPGYRWGARLILGIGLVTSLLVFAIEFVASWNWEYSAALAQSESLVVVIGYVLPSVILQPLTLIVDLVLVFRTLLLSSDAVAREQRGRTWQLLILTAQSPRKIVVGKWWATVLHLAPQYLMLSALRVGVVVLMGLEYYRIQYFYFGNNSQQFFSQTRPLPFVVSTSTLVVGAVLITLFTFANLVFTAAFGMCVSAVSRSARVGLQAGIAFALRIALLVSVAVPLLVVGNQARYVRLSSNPAVVYSDVADAALGAFGFSLLDNGTSVTAAFLTQPRYALNLTFFRIYTPVLPPESMGFLFGFYALLTVLFLGAAVLIIRRRAL